MDFKKDTKYSVFGIGNVIVDYFKDVDKNFLKSCNFVKGGTYYPDKVICILEGLQRSAGGTTANIINTLALLGCKTAFHGVVGKDEHGKFFKKSFHKNVDQYLLKRDGETAHLIALVTDGERTFSVNYGVAMQYERDKLPLDAIKDSKILHTSLFKFEYPNSRELVLEAMAEAKKNRVKVSLDLASHNLIGKLKSEFDIFSMLDRYIDIVFANEDEANEIGCRLEKLCEITVYKKGEKGSLVIENPKYKAYMVSVSYPGYQSNVVNTSGAGDAFAAGFLYCLINNKRLCKASELAKHLAHKVVEKTSSRLDAKDVSECKKDFKGLIAD